MKGYFPTELSAPPEPVADNAAWAELKTRARRFADLFDGNGIGAVVRALLERIDELEREATQTRKGTGS